jgi:hypothetical protein
MKFMTMSNLKKYIVLFIFIVVGGVLFTINLTRAHAGEHVSYSRWVELRSTRSTIHHRVSLSDTFRERLSQPLLRGPKAIVYSPEVSTCLCKYDFTDPVDSKIAGTLRVRFLDSEETMDLSVGAACAALIPGHILRDGPPTGDDGTTVYEVRNIVPKTEGQESMLFLCLPIEYQHHDEHMIPKDNKRSLLVLQEEKRNDDATAFGLVDDFGTNGATPRKQYRQVLSVQVQQ